MIKSVLLMCSILTVGGFNFFHQSNDIQERFAHEKWLQERYLEAITINAGMTRADLLKVYSMDSGLQSMLPARYVLKSCGMITVDVEFEVPEGAKGRVIPEDLRFEGGEDGHIFISNEKLKIKSISRPYIAAINYD